MTGDSAVVAAGSHDEVTSQGSVMYVFRSTFTGDPDAGTSHSCTVLGVTVRAAIRSDVCARIMPVVENPSSAANPAAAALEHVPCAFSVPPARVHAASGVSLPLVGSRSNADPGGTSNRIEKCTGSTCSCKPRSATNVRSSR